MDQELVNIVKRAKRCAIFTMGGIGDHLFALPFLWSFRHSYPNVRIVNITRQPLVPSFLLKANILDEVKVIRLPRRISLRKQYINRQSLKLWGQFIFDTINLSKDQYDVSIYLSTGLTLKLGLWQWLIGAEYKIGIDRMLHQSIIRYLLNYSYEIEEKEHHIENNLKLGKLMGCNIAGAMNCFNILFHNYVCSSKLNRNVFIHPFLETAEDDGRTWPLESFRKLYQILDRKGLRPVVIGTTKELKETKLDNWENLKTIPLASLEESICLLSGATLVIGNDSATVHLASLLGRPTLSVMCSSDPNFTYPYFNGGVARAEVDCSPCFHNKGFRKCKKFICREKITPEQIIAHPFFKSITG